MNIGTLDLVVIVVYLIGITAYGIWVGFRRQASSDQYFLANKSLGWFTVGAAVFTSNISTIHLVGLAASGAKEGLVIGNFEWMACFTLLLLALVSAPFYISSRVSTQGDQFGTIFDAINKIPMTFAPAVTTVFVLGIMWKRGTKQAAMTTLYVGSLIGNSSSIWRRRGSRTFPTSSTTTCSRSGRKPARWVSTALTTVCARCNGHCRPRSPS